MFESPGVSGGFPWLDSEGRAGGLGEVGAVHVEASSRHDGRVGVAAMRPLARLGYMGYAVIDRVFSMPRP